jgi:hypothetical protein
MIYEWQIKPETAPASPNGLFDISVIHQSTAKLQCIAVHKVCVLPAADADA